MLTSSDDVAVGERGDDVAALEQRQAPARVRPGIEPVPDAVQVVDLLR
jgi:hypothetical protein